MNSKTYITVVIGIVVAKLLGFAREAIFGRIYGTSTPAEIYTQIFGIVTLLFTGIGIALQTRVIMNLNKEENASPKKKKAYVSTFIGKTALCLAAVTAALYILARPFTKMLLPNFLGQDFETAVKMTYIMLPSLIFVSIAYIISGILQNNNVFFIPSIISLPSNIILITSLLGFEKNIYTIGILTTIGWFLHIIIQLPAFYKKGFKFIYRAPEINLNKKTHYNFNIWWIFISNMMFQLCFIIDRSFVSGNEELGLGSALSYASTIFTTISSVFVVAMSSVVFPALSKNYEEGNKDYVRDLFGYIILLMLVVFVPFILVSVFFGNQLISLIYNLSGTSALITGICFIIYCFGILGYLAQELVNKVFYLSSDYAFTVFGSVSVVAFKIITNFIFVQNTPKGAVIASLITSILLTLYAVASFIKLYHVIGKYLTKNVIISIFKIFIAGACAVAVYFLLRFTMPNLVNATSAVFVIPILICGVVYIAAVIALGLHRQLIRNPKKEQSTALKQ